jgi:hypothetical protein
MSTTAYGTKQRKTHRVKGATRLAAVLLSGLAVFVIGLRAGQPRAAGAPSPTSLTYGGLIESAGGVPPVGAHALVLDVWSGPTGAAGGAQPICEATSTQDLVGGHFAIPLPATCVSMLGAIPEAWIEVFFDGASLGLTKVGAVPRALRAAAADVATMATSANTAAGATGDFSVGNNLHVTGNVDVTGALGIGLRRSKSCVTYPFPGSNQVVTDCACAAGEVPMGGGGYSSSGNALQESRSVLFDGVNAWRVSCGNTQGVRVACDGAEAYCARLAN